MKKAGLLVVVDRKINKDTEMHPLVRWQFVGGIDQAERKAFLFTNIVNAHGRKYSMPVVVGAIAANRAIYSIGMGVPVEEIQAKWDHALAHPVKPRVVANAWRLEPVSAPARRAVRAISTAKICRLHKSDSRFVESFADPAHT